MDNSHASTLAQEKGRKLTCLQSAIRSNFHQATIRSFDMNYSSLQKKVPDMYDGHIVIDADSHKCENPIIFSDYIEPKYRSRLGYFRDRFGEQRFQIIDRDPKTNRCDFKRAFLQPIGYGKGTFRPYHPETTMGGLFNRIRIEHMEREGIDAQVIYGSVSLAFNSIIDEDLSIALCKAYNNYIYEDTLPNRNLLHPMGVLPLQNVDAALEEMRRCTNELDMLGVFIPPHIPHPHPDAPESFPTVRVPKHLSDGSYDALFEEAEKLDIPIGIHGAPGMYLAGGTSDQIDSFTLVHVFANRSMQQLAFSRMMFDGTFEKFPNLRVGFLEGGCGWLPDLMYSLQEHWEKRIDKFDPTIEPNPIEFIRELCHESKNSRGQSFAKNARNLLKMLFTKNDSESTEDEKNRFLYEHPLAGADPRSHLERIVPFFSIEPGDPAAPYLKSAFGKTGERLAGFAVDYGHWDAELSNCAKLVVDSCGNDVELAAAVLGKNALRFYGDRLTSRMITNRKTSNSDTLSQHEA